MKFISVKVIKEVVTSLLIPLRSQLTLRALQFLSLIAEAVIPYVMSYSELLKVHFLQLID